MSVDGISGFSVRIGSDDLDDRRWRSWEGAGASVDEDPVLRQDDGQGADHAMTLKGPLTSGRKALLDWMQATVQGKEWKRTLAVKEILKDGSDGRTYTFFDCFPTRYVFPVFDRSDDSEATEEVRVSLVNPELHRPEI